MRKTLLLSLLLTLTGTWLLGQAPFNITLAAQETTHSDLNDCWGWWDNSGNEYAIIGIQSGGVGIVNVTNPATPVYLQTIPGVPSLWRDIKTWGNYAYVVNDDGGSGGIGLLIIDMSTLPNTVVYKDTIISGMTVAHNLYIDNGYAYIVGADNNAGINILDVNTDPWNPTQVGQYTNTYVHDVYVRNNKAYSCELSNGLTVIDVTNKSNPTILGNKQYINNFTHNSWLSDNGNVCFTTDETSAGYVYAWDVTDPQNIEELDSYRSSLSGTSSIPHNTHVTNDYLVTSYYRDGMTVVDAAYPYNLIETGFYDTAPTLSGDGFDGNWGAFPFFPSGTAIASDMQGGLFIFNVAYTRGCYLEGDITDAVTTNPIPGATVTVSGQSWGDVADNDGFYATGTATPGTYTVTYSAFGYMDSTITVSMANGQLVDRDIPLQPVQPYSMTLNVIEQGSGTPIPFALVSFTESGGNVLNYTTDANGVVNVTSFIPSTYEVVAGKWGWRSEGTTYNGNSGNPSFTIELEPGYYDDFALDFSWTTASTASTGQWERGEPVGTYDFFGGEANPENDLTFDLSDQAYVTGNGGGGIGGDDIDDGIVVLTSPVMDLSGYQEPVLKYYRWFYNGGGQGSPNDSLTIEISNGLTTVVLNQLQGISNSWVQDTFVLAQYLTPTNNMTVTFRAGDYGSGHVVEAAIDGFEVVDLQPLATTEPQPETDHLEIFPNPIGQRATIRYEVPAETNRPLTFEVTDVLGRVQYERRLAGSQGEFVYENDLPAGVYFGSLKSEGEILKTLRLVR